METTQLNDLELQVDYLLSLVQQLQIDNKALRQRLADAVHDRSELQEQHFSAAAKIKLIISQLKEEIE